MVEKKRQRQRQQQIKILYRVTRRIVCEMTYRDYDTLRLYVEDYRRMCVVFRCLETGQRPVNSGNTTVFAPGKHIAHAEKVRTYKGYWNPQRKNRVATHFSR